MLKTCYNFNMPNEPRTPANPLLSLEEGDLDFVLQFALSSGSLKDMARVYGVSYPTLRGRLDRLIARLQEAIDGRAIDPMSELLATMIEHGEIAVSSARSIQETHRTQLDRAANTRKESEK